MSDENKRVYVVIEATNLVGKPGPKLPSWRSFWNKFLKQDIQPKPQSPNTPSKDQSNKL